MTTNPYASASLYVGDLSPEVTEATLFELFNTVGPVASIRVCRDVATRASLGYAYVNFHSPTHAERALETLNFSAIKGRQCRIMWSVRDKQMRENAKGNVFVKNLHETIDNKTLYDTFSVFGNILSCKVVTDPQSNKSRGYGYVNYTQLESAKKAIEGVNGMLIADRQVHAEPFVSRQERMKQLPWTNVYIKHIPSKMSEKELIDFVQEKVGGKITSSHMWEKPMFGKSACVNFENHEAALKCVEALNKYEMKEWSEENNGKPLKLYVTRSQKRTERDRYLKINQRRNRGRPGTAPAAVTNNLYVKPLAPYITDEKLRELFSQFGEIVSAKVMVNSETGQGRGFGFVCFTRNEDASQALVKMNDTVVEGVKLYVARAQKKAERQHYLASRARRASSRRLYGNNPMGGQSQYFPSHGPPMGGGYYSYPRPMQPQGQMHPAQYAQAQMVRQQPYFNQMMPMPQVPIQMPMPHMGVGMNPAQQFGHFPGMRMQNPPFGVGMQSQQQQPASSAALAGGAAASATMRSGVGNAGGISQGVSSVGGARSAQGMSSSGTGIPAVGAPTNYSQPQPVTAPQVQHGLYASAGQTGVEPSGAQSRPIQSFPSQMSATERETQPLTPQMLQGATAQERKRMIGERLFPKIQEVEPRLAGKITGMLLEMENTELLVLLSNKDQLRKKINEALSVLKEHHKKQSQRNSESQARQRTNSQGNQSASNRQSSSNNT